VRQWKTCRQSVYYYREPIESGPVFFFFKLVCHNAIYGTSKFVVGFDFNHSSVHIAQDPSFSIHRLQGPISTFIIFALPFCSIQNFVVRRVSNSIMVFKSPSWVPLLPQPPDSIPISEFILDEKFGRRPISSSRDPYTCGLSGKTFSTTQIRDRIDGLAKALKEDLGWEVNGGNEFEKAGAIFCLNTVCAKISYFQRTGREVRECEKLTVQIDLMTISWAIHKLNGISCPASAAYSASELAFQLKDARVTCLFTSISLLPITLKAAKLANIPKHRIYLCPISGESLEDTELSTGLKSLETLISRGKELPDLENLIWSPGQGKRQTAFICYSSGTSGLPVR
jgi:hypothetical protein